MFGADVMSPANLAVLQSALVGSIQSFPAAHAEIHRMSFMSAAFFLAAYRIEARESSLT